MTELAAASQSHIPGYDLGTARSAVSPISELELRLIEQTVGWNESHAGVLRRHGDIFKQQAEHMVDSWRSQIGAQPHLAKWFVGPDGQPDEEYKSAVKSRFVQWVKDVALREHDLDWLNYQEEIRRRHTPAKKNVTDQRHTPPLVPLRYLLGFIPVILPIRRFFADQISADELKQLEEAWTRAVLLHMTLWSRPYTQPDLW
jgi:hypothetical protein